MTPDRPVLVLVNPSAGSAEQERLEEVCRELGRSSSSPTEVQAPASDQDYAAVVASTEGRDVVVVGGDGSVNRLLQELTDQQLLDRVGAIGVVPLGTGNDLARGAGIPLDWREAVEVAVGGQPAERGLLLDQDGCVVVNVVHCGVAAEATAQAAEVKGILGRAAYAWGALRAGLRGRGWHLRVVVDGHLVVDGSDRVLLVSTALGSSVGGGTLIAPQARGDDGLVDVLVASGTSARARIGFAWDLQRAQHVDRDDVITVRGRQVLVEAAGPRDAFLVNADGDVSHERASRQRWELLPHTWRLRVPRTSGGDGAPQPLP